ncbi:DUF1800 domain-containing protein [Niastella caeni]|uniref:DUF1800 domain-containing protein n=1 Tax=Niastella caeni TaxID=2569763 RepID=A0A4S8HEP7_9BACT|nr:DUF1800 domain-containing protein [Niastella caeni]THU33548.1 DUF1800 domain-containing protein [Niastella caeni]
MDRREFFTLKRRAKATSPKPYAGLRQIYSGLTPYTGTWTVKEVSHLLKRTMFGAKKADIDYFLAMTPSAAVDALLNVPTGLPAPPLKNYDNTGIDATDGDIAVAQGATWVNTVSDDGTANGNRVNSLKSWWIGNMINQDRSIREKMTLFWHNHFATETIEYERGTYGYRYNTLLRESAVGNFKKLVKDMTLNIAMLRYLNGYLNTNTAPDENYARELQELFTLGKENNPNYTEDDVKAAARVLTGWRIKKEDETIFFNANQHDRNSKTFSSFFNGTVIAGRSDAAGAEAELDDLINMIFAKSVEVSEFIVKKLYTWFVYYTIEPDTITNVIKPLAQQFRDGGWEIKPVLATLLKSEHFFDILSQGCLIKSPIEMIVMMMREFDVAFPADYENQYYMWDYLRSQATTMQQNLFDPPSVSGWPAYYQVPQFYEMWINHDTMPKREMFIDLLIVNGYTRNNVKLIIDPVAFTENSFPTAVILDPNTFIDAVLDILYRVPLSATVKTNIKTQILLLGQYDDHYWTNAWFTYIGDKTNMAGYSAVFNRLQPFYKYLMNLAEYQLA